MEELKKENWEERYEKRNNGWEIGAKNYGEKIRFIVTFRPETLINLFTRKWF